MEANEVHLPYELAVRRSRFQRRTGHGILYRQISRKWYKRELYIYIHVQWQTDRNSHMIYQMVPVSMTLNGIYPRFQGRTLLQKLCTTSAQISAH